MVIKHIYWFAYYSLHSPSVRYRGKYPLETLFHENGVTYSLTFPGYQLTNIIHFLRVYLNVLLFRRTDSIIVFQKIYSRGIYALFLKFLLLFRRKGTIYDIDDAEYLRFSPSTIDYLIRRSSGCSVGSIQLLRYAERFTEKTAFLTTPVINHDKRKGTRNKLFTIGWIGYYNSNKEISKEYSHKTCFFRVYFQS